MNRTPESNQEVMESLFPAWREYPLNSLNFVVLKRDELAEPIVLTMKYVGDDETIQAFKAENEGGHVDIKTTLWAEEDKDKTNKSLAISFDFTSIEGNPKMKAVVSGEDVSIQNEFIQALYNITHFYLFIADKNGKLIKVKQVDWSYMEHIGVLSQFNLHGMLN